MRSAERIGRTPRQWAEAQDAARRKTLAELLETLRRARDHHAPWYQWVLARAERRHEHDRRDERGNALECPVPECREHPGSLL